jgi:hypothetical protein
MRLIDVKDGGLYEARVSGRLVPVRVVSRHVPPAGRIRVRLVCRNEATGREIRCSAQRLRRPWPHGEYVSNLTGDRVALAAVYASERGRSFPVCPHCGFPYEGNHPDTCPIREDAAVTAAEQAIEDGQARWSETGTTRKS